MEPIKSIKRIAVDLLKLKPITSQKKVYNAYKTYLENLLSDELRIKNCLEYISCPMCDGFESQLVSVIDNFKYVKCKNCNSIYNNPRLKDKYLKQMYSDGIYKEYTSNLTIPGNQIRSNLTEVRKVEQVNSLFKNKGKLLDVGCGAGTFLKIANKSGWNTTGIEISNSASAKSKKENLKVLNINFNNFSSNEKFDCITFWGFLEHVINPLQQIKKAKSILNDNGIIVFEVPSSDCLLMEYIIDEGLTPFRFIESARHLTFFSKEAIKNICNLYNLKLVHLETNGLDIQTILLNQFNKVTTKKLMNIQKIVDQQLLGDHYRVFLKNKNEK